MSAKDSESQVTLWTFQHQGFVRELEVAGRTRAEWSRTPENFRAAYRWMTERMCRHCGAQGVECDDVPPIWCWQTCSRDGDRTTLPDTPPDDQTAWDLFGGVEGCRGMVLLELRVPCALALRSSYALWNELLEHALMHDSAPAGAAFERMFEAPFLAHGDDSIQVALPHLDPAWVRSTRALNIERDPSP